MPETDAERLVVLLEARIRDFEKNMEKASKTAGSTYGKMRKDSRSATDAMEADMLRSTSRINQALAAASMKVGTYGKAFAAGLVGGLTAGGISAIVNQVASVANEVAEVGRQAKIAGLSNKVFQELGYVAKANRIEIGALTDGMKELSLRADEFVQTGGGSASEAFQRLGFTAEELSGKLKDPSKLFTEIIGKLGQLDKAAQIRISDELFGGTGGEKFVSLISQGEAGIRRTIDEAHRLGAVMDDEVIARAEELDRKFQAVANTVGTALKTAIVEAASSLQRFIESFWGFEDRSTQVLKDRVTELQAMETKLQETAGTFEDSFASIFGQDAASQTTRIREEIEKINAVLKQREGTPIITPEQVETIDTATGYLKTFRQELTLSERERRVAAESERIMADAASKGAKVTREQADELANLVVQRDENEKASKRGATATAKESDAVEDLIRSVMQRTDQLKLETALMGSTGEAAEALRVEQELLASAMEKGIPLSDALRRKFKELAAGAAEAASAYGAARLEQDLLFERQQLGRSPNEQEVYERLRQANVDILSAQGERLATEIRITQQARLTAARYEEQAEIITDSIGAALMDVFDGGTKSVDEFLDHLTSGLARIAQNNIMSLLDGTAFQGMAVGGAGSPYPQEGESFADRFDTSVDKMGPSVQQGSFAGVRDGMAKAFEAMGMSKTVAGNAADGLSAAAGAFAQGYQSADPLMGGLSGAMSGAAAGTMIMPGIGTVIGAIVGGISGALGGLLGQDAEEKKQKEQARAALQQNTLAITALMQFSRGEQPGTLQKSYLEQYDANLKLQQIAQAAGDKSLVNDLQNASNRTFSRIYDQFLSDFNDFNEALRQGLGANSPLMEGKAAIRGLAEQVQSWIGDVRFLTTESDKLGGGNIGVAGIAAKVQEAQQAGQEMILSALRGVEALSPVAEELQRIEGASKAALQPLTDLGMSVEEATAKIADAAADARQRLADNFMEGVDARYYASADMGYVNDLGALAEFTKAQLENSAGLSGLGLEKIRKTFVNEAQRIVDDSDLSAAQVAEASGILAEVLAEIGMSIPQAMQESADAVAETWAEFDRTLQAKLNSARGQDYRNSLAALIDEVTGMRDMGSLERIDEINAYMTAAAQQIAEQSGLTGDAIRDLARDFPTLGIALRSAADGIDEAAAAAARAERAAAAAAAAAARREASLGLQSGLLSRTSGSAAAADFELGQLAVGNASLSGIRSANSIGEARAQLEAFIATIRRTAVTAEDLTQAGQLAYETFDDVASRIEDTSQGFESLFSDLDQFQQRSAENIRSSFTDLQEEMRGVFDDAIDGLLDQRRDLFDAIAGGNSFLYGLATQGTNPESAYQTMLARFDDASRLASSGNPDALRGLTSQGDELLRAAAAFFPEGTSQYNDVLEKVRGAVGSSIGAATDRANDLSSQIERQTADFNAGFDRLGKLAEQQVAAVQAETAKVVEQLKLMQQTGAYSAAMISKLTELLASGKTDAQIVKGLQDIARTLGEVADQQAASNRRRA